MAKTFATHYENLGLNVEDFKCSPHHIVVDAHADFLKTIFKCLPNDRVVDLGAGNCLFAKKFIEKVELNHPMLCVEPVQAMLEHGTKDPRIETLCMNALDFAEKNDTCCFDRIVVRMAVHHFGNENLPKIFKGVYNQLNPGGVFVIIRMAACENLPWFQKLKDTFNSYDPTHLPDQVMLNLLSQSGFNLVEKELKSSKHSISKENLWISLRQCYVSTLRKLTSQEIENGISELNEKYANEEFVEYFEDFDFFIAKKSPI